MGAGSAPGTRAWRATGVYRARGERSDSRTALTKPMRSWPAQIIEGTLPYVSLELQNRRIRYIVALELPVYLTWMCL